MEDLIKEFNITPEQQEFDIKNSKLCHAIYWAMKERGMTQNDLAKEMGVDKSLVSRWLGGVHFMGVDTIMRIEKALEITIINQDFLQPGSSDTKKTVGVGLSEHEFKIKLASTLRIQGSRMGGRKKRESKKTDTYSATF